MPFSFLCVYSLEGARIKCVNVDTFHLFGGVLKCQKIFTLNSSKLHDNSHISTLRSLLKRAQKTFFLEMKRRNERADDVDDN